MNWLRIAIFCAILALGGHASATIDAKKSISELQSADPAIRRESIRDFADNLDTFEVKEYGDELLPVLLRGVQDTDSEVRRYAFASARLLAHAVILSRQAPEKRVFGRKVSIDFRNEPRLKPLFVLATFDSNADIRACAVSVLGKAYPPGKDIEEALIRLASTETHSVVSREIVDGLGAGDYRSVESNDALLMMLSAKNESVRGWAGYFLGRAKAKKALPRLLAALADEHPFVREKVLEGIVAFGAEARPHLPQLRAILAKEKKRESRRAIEVAIRKLEGTGKPQ